MPDTLAQYFQFSPATSFRMVNENPVIDPRANNRNLDDTIDISGYAQKWQTNDVNARIQVFTPYEDDAVGIYNYFTDVKVQDVPLVPITPPLLDQPFICANALPDFSSIGTGIFYIKYTYTDGNGNVQDIRSSPLSVQANQPGTMLYQASHNTNDKSTIFVNADGSPVIFTYRIEAIIREPLAKNASATYADQYESLTNESYIPYDNYTNYIGIACTDYRDRKIPGLPYWAVKKFNFVYSLDNVKLEGDFVASTGDEFKPTRPTNQLNEDGYWGIAIQPTYQKNYQQYKTGTPLPTTFKVIELSDDYKGNTANITKSGLYKDGIELVGVTLKNIGGDAFTMVLSASSDPADEDSRIVTIDVPAVDPDSTEIDKQSFSDNVRHLFTAVRTLYVTGLTGTNCDIYFRYIDYNAPNYTPPVAGQIWRENTVYAFRENDPDVPVFGTEFDVATGFGRVGTEHENCILIDDYANKFLIGFDRVGSPASLGTRIGNALNKITQTIAQMARHTHTLIKVAAGSLGTTPSQVAANEGNGSAPGNGNVISFTGGNSGGTTDPMDITPDSYVVAYFYYKKP